MLGQDLFGAGALFGPNTEIIDFNQSFVQGRLAFQHHRLGEEIVLIMLSLQGNLALRNVNVIAKLAPYIQGPRLANIAQ